MSVVTNWYIITGGPSSGKTKTLEYLSFDERVKDIIEVIKALSEVSTHHTWEVSS